MKGGNGLSCLAEVMSRFQKKTTRSVSNSFKQLRLRAILGSSTANFPNPMRIRLNKC